MSTSEWDDTAEDLADLAKRVTEVFALCEAIPGDVDAILGRAEFLPELFTLLDHLQFFAIALKRCGDGLLNLAPQDDPSGIYPALHQVSVGTIRANSFSEATISISLALWAILSRKDLTWRVRCRVVARFQDDWNLSRAALRAEIAKNSARIHQRESAGIATDTSRMAFLADYKKSFFERYNGRLQPRTKPSKRSTPTTRPIITLNPAQITLEGAVYPLSPDQALYLQALVDAQDWMSDAEFRRGCPEVGDSARPDRWRDKLPGAVKARIEKHKGNAGHRWV